MSAILYGVGVGPGDPKLLTLKAIETIKACKIIAVPDTGRNENTALNIINDYISGKELLYCYTPMTKSGDELIKAHMEIADKIGNYLEKGTDVAFITLGDPSIYSTYMYVHRMIAEKGYVAKLIPGVTSFCAVAAALGISLCDGDTSLHILPSSYEDTEQALDLKGTKVLMKSGSQLKTTLRHLKDKGLLSRSSMVERATMPDERVFVNLDTDIDMASYFSTIVVKGDRE